MPLLEKYIDVTDDYFIIRKWDSKNEKNEDVSSLIIRFYNALKYKDQDTENTPVWVANYNYNTIKNMIDTEKKVNIRSLTHQPLVMTVEEEHDIEKVLNLNVGHAYDITLSYQECSVGPAPQKLSFIDKLKRISAEKQKTEYIFIVDIPTMPDMVRFPKNLLHRKVVCDNGSEYIMHFPNLQEGRNRFFYDRSAIEYSSFGNVEVREDLKQIFRIKTK